MSKQPNSFRLAAKLLHKRDDVVPSQEEEAHDDKDTKRQTLYLPIAVHDQIRDIAHAKRCSQQELFRRALDHLFAEEGLPSWGELTKRK